MVELKEKNKRFEKYVERLVAEGKLDSKDLELLETVPTLEGKKVFLDQILSGKRMAEKDKVEEEYERSKLNKIKMSKTQPEKLRFSEFFVYYAKFKNVPPRFLVTPAELMDVLHPIPDDNIMYGMVTVSGRVSDIHMRFLGWMLDMKERAILPIFNVCGGKWFMDRGLTAADTAVTPSNNEVLDIMHAIDMFRHVEAYNELEIIKRENLSLKAFVERVKKTHRKDYYMGGWEGMRDAIQGITDINLRKVGEEKESKVEKVKTAIGEHKFSVGVAVGIIAFILIILFLMGVIL